MSIDPGLPEEAIRRMHIAWAWIESFLTHPSTELGREGDVCPYMRRAMRKNYVAMRAFDMGLGDVALAELVRNLREDMLDRAARLEQTSERNYVAAIIVPFGAADELMVQVLGRIQPSLKPEFVERGLMLGEFWPGHQDSGLHNEDFRPLASPLPMLAMRHMVLSDLGFLTKARVSPQTQAEFLSCYRRTFTGQLTAQWERKLSEAEAVATLAAVAEAGAGV